MCRRTKLFCTALTASLVFAALAGPAASQGSGLVPRGSETPSFDCTKAKTAAARLICADGELARLDADLGVAFQRRKAQISGPDQARFVAEQIAWIRDRNTRCDLVGRDAATVEALAGSKACMVKVVQERISALTQIDPVAVSGCSKDGDVVTIQGRATSQPLELADGSLRNVWVLAAAKPICVVDSITASAAPHEMSVSRFQIIGQPPPSDTAIELTGKLSTGNITQYYLEPEAITVMSGRRIAATSSPNASQAASKFDANSVAASIDRRDGIAPRSTTPASLPTKAQQSDSKDGGGGGWLLLFLIGLYFLPSIVGSRHHNASAIFILNLFLGWTFLGWVIALVWACTKSVSDIHTEKSY